MQMQGSHRLKGFLKHYPNLSVRKLGARGMEFNEFTLEKLQQLLEDIYDELQVIHMINIYVQFSR